MSDEEILRLYHDGDTEKAFSEIVRTYGERLFWHVRRFVCCHEDADDLVQEIFVKIWAALPSFREEARLLTWIYRIATNETLNFIRRQKLRAALSFKSIDAEMERRIDEDPYFDGTGAEKALMKALSHLPDRQRMVFSLRYFDELPYSRISEIAGISEGALKASYHIAVEKLKRQLSEEDDSLNLSAQKVSKK